MSDNGKKLPLHIILATVVIIAAVGVGIFLGKKNPGNIEDSRLLLDTVVTIRLYESRDKKALEGAFDVIRQYEDLFSRHREGSDISRINEAPAGTAVSVSPETLEVLQTALEYSRLSGGFFDPTVGPLVDLWGIGTENAHLPEPYEITRTLALVDYHKVAVYEKEEKVGLADPGMSLDLGAVAKGWIADKTAEYLRQKGLKHFIINLGGNILVSGGKPDGTPFRIGMQKPFAETGRYIGIFEVSDASVVSSGVYERYFERNGVRYHHILNTKNGYPVSSGLEAVTVLTARSVDGDALSTTLFALGLEKGSELAISLEGVEAAFITEDGSIYMTEGAAEIFDPADRDLEIKIIEDRRLF